MIGLKTKCFKEFGICRVLWTFKIQRANLKLVTTQKKIITCRI